MTIERINPNLPISSKFTTLNSMILEVNGKVGQGKFDVNGLDNIYSLLSLSRKYLRNQLLGNTLVTYSDWTHIKTENGYSIWRFPPTSYAYNSVNELYFDDTVVTDMGEADSVLAATFDEVYVYDDSITTYTSYATEAGTEGGTAFGVLATTDDYFYVGEASTFAGIKFEWAVRGYGYDLTYEYWNGSAWAALSANTNNLDDNTSDFSSDGLVSWDLPDDWATNAVNSTTKYWIRVSTADTPTILATCYYCVLGDSVVGLLALSSAEILAETWKWASYSTYIYVTIRNSGTSAYEGSYYITSSSTATNKQNFFIYNHDFKANYLASTYNPVVTVTTDYDVTGSEGIILVDDESGGTTVTLPTAVDNEGVKVTIKKIGNLANITIDCYSGETIDGGATQTLDTQYEAVTLVSNGSDWFIISHFDGAV